MPDVDRFLSVSDYYVPVMSDLLRVERSRITVVPLGINLAGYTPRTPSADGVFCVGYFARLAPEKGLQQLAEAYTILRRRTGDASLRLEAAGYLGGAQQPYLDGVRRTLDAAGLGDWTPNPRKFPRGLAAFADDIHALGMRFGLWVEPEMVNPDSDLYRAHPDWIYHFPHRTRTTARNQKPRRRAGFRRISTSATSARMRCLRR